MTLQAWYNERYSRRPPFEMGRRRLPRRLARVTAILAGLIAASAGTSAASVQAGPVTPVGLPAQGPAAGGTTVVLVGKFEPWDRVKFGSVEAPCQMRYGSGQITVVSPAHDPGTVAVTVSNPVLGPEQPRDLGQFTYRRTRHSSLLTVRRVTPNEASSEGGTEVGIEGRGFCRYPGLTVDFGERPAQDVDVFSDTQLRVLAPPNPEGPSQLTVAAGPSRGRSRFTYTGAEPTQASENLSGGTTTTTLEPPESLAQRGQGWFTCATPDAAPGCPAPLRRARSLHTMTVLDGPGCSSGEPLGGYPCGDVLVVGGGLDSVELYNPGTGRWRSVAPLGTARTNHTATLLADGRVLVAGGRSNGPDRTLASSGEPSIYDPAAVDNTLASAEVYDPVTDTWTGTGSMVLARSKATATALDGPECSSPSSPDWCGKVLMAGGSTEEQEPYLSMASAELYDATSGSWQRVADMSQTRVFHTATPLPDGRVLVAGGLSATGPTQGRSSAPATFAGERGGVSTAEIYDPTTVSWQAASPMALTRWAHTATLLADGRVLVVGGIAGSNLASAEVYDPVANAWSPTGPLRRGRAAHSTTLLSDGRAVVAGGREPFLFAAERPRSSAEIYDPSTNRWEDAGALHHARGNHTAALTTGRECRASAPPPWCARVLVVGGDSTYDDPAFAHLSSPLRREFARLAREPLWMMGHPPLRTAELYIADRPFPLPALGPSDARSRTAMWIPLALGLLAGVVPLGLSLRFRHVANRGTSDD